MNNLEAFNVITAQVFAACYTSFPLEQDFSIDDIVFDVSWKKKIPIFYNTFIWLERYNWITINKSSTEMRLCGVQLTEKALYSLNLLPETLDNCKPLGQRISDAIATQSTASVIGNLVNEAIKAFFK